VDETSFVSVLINSAGVATVAGATSLAVHNNLSVEGDRGGTLQAVKDVESVSDGRCGTLSPAGAAVLGNVLVL
jgi:hypothetical protein